MLDDSILPTEIAVSLGLLCNIGIPLLAFWVAGKLPRFRLWIHAVAFVIILASPLTAMILGLPDLLPEEEESPGARFAFLPLIIEAAIIVLLYCLAGAMLLSQSIHSAITDWHGRDRLSQPLPSAVPPGGNHTSPKAPKRDSSCSIEHTGVFMRCPPVPRRAKSFAPPFG